ncbi:MAG TPA: hypothetical protein VMR23_13935 [Candidatus Limnocylindria bacterium]|nr:hypothetical protein [Candidatus Limnocylindria bacterium]
MECDRRDPLGEPARCENAGVRRFPTWQIAGTRLEGVLTLDEIARASGYTAESSATR